MHVRIQINGLTDVDDVTATLPGRCQPSRCCARDLTSDRPGAVMPSTFAYRRLALVVSACLLAGGAAVTIPAAHAAPASKPACTDVQSDARAAATMARRCGTKVEVLAARTETDRVLANPSGTYTLVRAVMPQRVKQPGGGWAPIDTTLRAAPDGTVVPRAATRNVRLSGGGVGPVATMTTDSGDISLFWPNALPTPRLEGDSAVYADVFDGVDLRVRALSTGFTYALVVKTRKAAANHALRQIRLGLRGEGLTLRDRPGGIEAVDKAGKAVITSSGAASMWDSAT